MDISSIGGTSHPVTRSIAMQGPGMNRTIPQRRLLIFVLAAGIAGSLAQGALAQSAASHNPNGIPGLGMAGRPQEIPVLEKQQVDCARPAFQGSVVSASIRATAPPSEQAKPIVFDKSCGPRTGLLRAHSGRAPPRTFSP